MTVMRAMLFLAALCLAAPAAAQTGAEAFARGCGGGCHQSETRVLGGFTWSSQHRGGGWCDGWSAAFGSGFAG